MAASLSEGAPRRLFAGALVLVALFGCSEGTSWVEELQTTATRPTLALPADVADFLAESETWGEPGGCFASISDDPAADEPGPTEPTVEVTRGMGNDPYTATGARQVPGPAMARFAAPEEPVYQVVARPADPNEHDPAGKPEGGPTGPMPEPRIIDSSTPTTPPETSEVDPNALPTGQCG